MPKSRRSSTSLSWVSSLKSLSAPTPAGCSPKLGFAITAILKTDIILVDEVLSVGDAHFKKKSFAKMQELISRSAHRGHRLPQLRYHSQHL